MLSGVFSLPLPSISHTHQQLGLPKYPLIDSISGWAWPDRWGLSRFMGSWSCHGCQDRRAVRTKECDEQVGNLAPGVHCKYPFMEHMEHSQLVFPLTSLRMFLFIRCFNFTKQARELGFGIFISFFLIICQLPTDCQRINQRISKHWQGWTRTGYTHLYQSREDGDGVI